MSFYASERHVLAVWASLPECTSRASWEILDPDCYTSSGAWTGSTAVLAKTSHANCRTTLTNRPSRGRRGRFVRVVQQSACEVFQRTALHSYAALTGAMRPFSGLQPDGNGKTDSVNTGLSASWSCWMDMAWERTGIHGSKTTGYSRSPKSPAVHLVSGTNGLVKSRQSHQLHVQPSTPRQRALTNKIA